MACAPGPRLVPGEVAEPLPRVTSGRAAAFDLPHSILACCEFGSLPLDSVAAASIKRNWWRTWLSRPPGYNGLLAREKQIGWGAGLGRW
jgi:hypothetical protein